MTGPSWPALAWLACWRRRSSPGASAKSCERDHLRDDGAAPRRSVPQGRHVHGLLPRGSRALERRFPDILREMRAGAPSRSTSAPACAGSTSAATSAGSLPVCAAWRRAVPIWSGTCAGVRHPDRYLRRHDRHPAGERAARRRPARPELRRRSRGARGIGTARALPVNAVVGTFAGSALGLNGSVAALLVPAPLARPRCGWAACTRANRLGRGSGRTAGFRLAHARQLGSLAVTSKRTPAAASGLSQPSVCSGARSGSGSRACSISARRSESFLPRLPSSSSGSTACTPRPAAGTAACTTPSA
jgi:hypothetical protein